LAVFISFEKKYGTFLKIMLGCSLLKLQNMNLF
jgi:hypothetical protein